MIEHLVPAFYKSPSTASLSAQALIHPRAWKRGSKKFAFTGFSGVQRVNLPHLLHHQHARTTARSQRNARRKTSATAARANR
jgi:hypothetical protein